MRTKGFGKLIALVLCMAMAFSVSSTALAAESSGSEYSNIEVENKPAIVSADDALAGSSAAVVHYRQLDQGTGIGIPLGSLSVGQTVTVGLQWDYSESTTTTPVIDVALLLSTQSNFTIHRLTGTSATVTFTIKTAGTFSLFLGNPSSSYDLDVYYTILISV